MIDIKKLKLLTAKAVQDNALKESLAEELRIAEEAKAREKAKLKAQGIIRRIEAKAKKAAKNGENNVNVMKFDYTSFIDNVNEKFSPFKAAFYVFEYCEKSNLNPKIENWHDGMGVRGGFQIVISW